MKIKVIKIGGNVVDNEVLLEQFAKDFAALEGPKILVHGGGVAASRMQKQLGMEPQMVAGRRVTDDGTLQIVTMVYAGWCNKHITALLQKNGCNAIGMTGADGNAICASRRPPMMIEGHGTVDFGHVGDVTPESINTGFLMQLLSAGLTPVFCAINHDGNGHLLNTNADTVASSIAVAIANFPSPDGNGAETSSIKDPGQASDSREKTDKGTGPTKNSRHEVELIYCFEKDGVLHDKDDDSSLIPVLTHDSYMELKQEGRIADGMIPKLDNSFQAMDAGVAKVIIKHAGNLNSDKGTVLTKDRQ